MAGGIGKSGTEAAARFLTSSRYLQLLDASPVKDWSKKNVEAVLKVKVIDGKAGPPEVEAVFTW